MFYKIFSPFYYKTKVTDHEKIKISLIDYIQTQYAKNPNNQPESWSCKVHTSLSKVFDQKVTSIKEFYQKDVAKFINDLKVPALTEVLISDIWFNAYKKGQWQESHHHYGKQSIYFSAVHFLKYDKEIHPPLIFNNMNRMIFTPCNIGRTTSLDYWDLDKVVDAEEGDLIIFPSFIEHQVNVQETEELRSTISFNIELKYNE